MPIKSGDWSRMRTLRLGLCASGTLGAGKDERSFRLRAVFPGGIAPNVAASQRLSDAVL